MTQLTLEHLTVGKYTLFNYKGDWPGLMTIDEDGTTTAVDICRTMAELFEKEQEIGFRNDSPGMQDYYLCTFDSIEDFRNIPNTHPELLI
jgi:hypothetical protein